MDANEMETFRIAMEKFLSVGIEKEKAIQLFLDDRARMKELELADKREERAYADKREERAHFERMKEMDLRLLTAQREEREAKGMGN